MHRGKLAEGFEESEKRMNGMGNIAIAESLVDGIADCFIEEAIQYKENKARMELPEENSRVYRNGRTTKRWYATLGFRLAACVALGILIGFSSIMGATAAGNLKAYEYLYQINPGLAESMMPVQKTCTDQGIEMKVEAVRIEGKKANVYVSLRDLEGDRIDQTLDLFDSYSVNTNCDQASGCSLVSYDKETKTASFLIQIDQHTEKFEGKRLTFSVSKLLLQKQEVTMELPQIHLEDLKEKTQEELYEASELEFRGQGGLGLEEFGKETKYAWHYLKPDEKQAFQAVRGAGITAYGLVDGMLHVQVYYEDIIQKDNHGDIRLKDENGKEYICLGNISFWDKEHKGSYEEYLFEPMGDGDFKNFTVLGWFVTGAELLEGDWEISFPIENREEQKFGDNTIIWGEEGEGGTMDAVLGTEMTQFMQYFMECPVLDTFTQEDPYKILYFSIYKMVQEQDERVCHDEENHRYSVKTEALREYMMEHFAVEDLPLDYLEVLKYYGGDIGIGHEDVIFVEYFQQGGGVPVIDSLVAVGDKYYLSGHVDGVETELPSTEQLLDGGPILRRFQATVIKDENDAWKLYEFVRNP